MRYAGRRRLPVRALWPIREVLPMVSDMDTLSDLRPDRHSGLIPGALDGIEPICEFHWRGERCGRLACAARARSEQQQCGPDLAKTIAHQIDSIERSNHRHLSE